MHTRHSRKAKSAAADFVKRVISGHDTSPGPSSKPSKTQASKAKQAATKSGDVSRSPSRGRSPAASKMSPAPKSIKGAKSAGPGSAKASPAAKEVVSKSSKASESKDQPAASKVSSAKAATSSSSKKADASTKEKPEQNQVVPEVITIKSEDEEETEEVDIKKADDKQESQEVKEVKQEVVQKDGEKTKDELPKEKPVSQAVDQVKPQEPSPSNQVPVKRGRGRPRKIPREGGCAVPIIPKPPPIVKVPSAPPALPSNPLVPGKRPRGRPRKYPPGMTAAMYKTKALERQNSSPKTSKKAESKYYSKISRLSMGGGIGALTIKIKDDYMLQEGGMVSPRHPTIMCEQDEFFKIFGLIKKSELDEMNRRTHTLHRAAGGKLRRLIKPKISPEMVYRNFMLNKSTALGVVPDEWDSSDEYDESSPMAKLVKSHSAPSTPDHAALLASPPKVTLLPKGKGLLKSLKGAHWSSPEEGSGPKKQWLKPPPKTPKRSSIEDALEAAKEIPKDVKHKKLEKPTLKKQKSDPGGKSKVTKLEIKSKSLDAAAKAKAAAAASTYRFKPTGGYRPLAPPPKIVEEDDPTAMPSRRSARNRGGQRKQWWHLLRANPDEYIPDHKWEEEVAVKEKKKQARIQRRTDGDGEEEPMQEEEEEEEEEVKLEPGEVIPEKPKRKRKRKVKELLTLEEIEILEAEERAMEERQRQEEKAQSKSSAKTALKRLLVPESSEEHPWKVSKTDSGQTSPSVIAKKKKKKKKKLKDRGKFHYMARVDRRGSVLTIQKGSKTKEYMIFDSDFNLVSVHDDSNMYQLTANALVQLAKQEGWGNLGQEVIEIVLPNRLVKEKLRSQICERMAPTVTNVQEEREKSCITPHMCQVCWINDHMYCANMKRTGRHLLQGGSCLHYTLCSHYRNLSPKETYARFATVAQFGSGGITKNFSISRLKDRDFAKSSRVLSEEGTSITISGGKLLAQGSKGDAIKGSQVTITVNNAAKADVQEKNPPKKAEDLVCHEELGESDGELPSTPGGDSKSTNLLSKHLWVRARQIAQSLGFADVREAMESLKKSSAMKLSEAIMKTEVIELDKEDEDIPVQDFVEVELEEFSDSDSDYEEEISKKKYGVPLSTKVRTCQPTTPESVIKIHLMPVLEHSRSKFYIKCKDRKIMKVQFGGRAQYREEEQEWKVENDTYTMKDVTRKYQKRMIKLAKAQVINASPTAEKVSPVPKQSGESQEKSVAAQSKTSGTPRVIWSSELDLEGQSPKSKSSPDQPPAKKQKLNSGESVATPKRKSEDIGQGDGFRSPDSESNPKQDRSADSSPCLSQGSAASCTSTSSAQGQQLLNASPVKLPKPSTSVPAELQNHVSSSKDGSQTLTFTTKDIRQCKPELIQYIKSANLIAMIHKTLTEERNSIEKLLKDGDGDVSRLKDSLEQNECLLLAVKSEAKEVKIKLVDFEMNVITEQNKAARLERRKTKLNSLYDNAHKKMSAFQKAMDKVQALIENRLDSEPSAEHSQNVGYTLLKLSDGSTLPAPEGTTVATINPASGSMLQTSGGILTAASAAVQLPEAVAMETIVSSAW